MIVFGITVNMLRFNYLMDFVKWWTYNICFTWGGLFVFVEVG